MLSLDGLQVSIKGKCAQNKNSFIVKLMWLAA
jgi:hypothetical protein